MRRTLKINCATQCKKIYVYLIYVCVCVFIYTYIQYVCRTSVKLVLESFAITIHWDKHTSCCLHSVITHLRLRLNPRLQLVPCRNLLVLFLQTITPNMTQFILHPRQKLFRIESFCWIYQTYRLYLVFAQRSPLQSQPPQMWPVDIVKARMWRFGGI